MDVKRIVWEGVDWIHLTQLIQYKEQWQVLVNMSNSNLYSIKDGEFVQ